VAELEHVADLDRWRYVADAEVVTCAAVNANGNADHGRNRDTRGRSVASGRSRQVQAETSASRIRVVKSPISEAKGEAHGTVACRFG
jgi:hypothetical protein